MRKLWILLGVAAVALYLGLSSIIIVNEREQAIVARFGEITRVHSEPGLYFKIPTDFIETVQMIEDRLLRYDLQDITLQVSGGKFYEVDAFLTYRIVDPVRFRQTVQGNLMTAEQRIDSTFKDALRDVYGVRQFEAALSEERQQMMREARDSIREGIAEIGIEVIDVRILRTDLTTQVSQQTFDRMSAERLAEAALLRARGQEQAQTIRAIADRQAVEIVAAARRDSEILRGEGEAERNKIFASAFMQDQDFFEFYRSLQSYREALGHDSTTMLLSPDSEFFEFFGNSGAAEAPSAPLDAAPAVVPQVLEEPGDVDQLQLPELSDDGEPIMPTVDSTDAVTMEIEPATDATPAIETPEAAPADQ